MLGTMGQETNLSNEFSVARFVALGAVFFGLEPFFEVTLAGATCAPCSSAVAALSLVSAFVM
jgi:hypothetical protein